MVLPKMKVREVECKSAIGKCGFPGGGWAVNPYIGCGHGCLYCYARFIKRFTGHTEKWGSFVDARVNIAEVLQRQLKSGKYQDGPIYIGTVTDPYQPLERKYRLTRKILEVLKDYPSQVSILTKSDLVFRDLDLLKQFRNIDVNFTINNLDKKWKDLTEPYSSSVEERFKAAKNLTKEGVTVLALMGPYWPHFTNPEKLFQKFKEAGIKHVFTESFNTIGGNFSEVEKILRKYYPDLLPQIKETLFSPKRFYDFYRGEEKKIRKLSQKYNLPITIYFGLGHAAKFK